MSAALPSWATSTTASKRARHCATSSMKPIAAARSGSSRTGLNSNRGCSPADFKRHNLSNREGQGSMMRNLIVVLVLLTPMVAFAAEEAPPPGPIPHGQKDVTLALAGTYKLDPAHSATNQTWRPRLVS